MSDTAAVQGISNRKLEAVLGRTPSVVALKGSPVQQLYGPTCLKVSSKRRRKPKGAMLRVQPSSPGMSLHRKAALEMSPCSGLSWNTGVTVLGCSLGVHHNHNDPTTIPRGSLYRVFELHAGFKTSSDECHTDEMSCYPESLDLPRA